MVERGEISEIVIAHKDGLVRFGFEWFEKFVKIMKQKFLS